MSDFPEAGKYRNTLSLSHLRRLEQQGYSAGNGGVPIVIKKEKGACLYDIDDNKYVDFSLNGGTVIAGHGNKTLTQFVKNGFSAGSVSGRTNKFALRLTGLFRETAAFRGIAFFGCADVAFAAIIRAVKPSSIGVTSEYLLEKLSPFGAVAAQKEKRYDLLFYEPVDFDGDLGETRPSEYPAGRTCAVESRTAFRLKYGFISNSQQCDFLLSADNIANGLDSAVVFSSSAIKGQNLPVYKTVAVLETLKYFRRHIDYDQFGRQFVKARENGKVIWNKNIFKLKKRPDPASLVRQGIILEKDVGFLCTEHTEQDWKRLAEAAGLN